MSIRVKLELEGIEEVGANPGSAEKESFCRHFAALRRVMFSKGPRTVEVEYAKVLCWYVGDVRAISQVGRPLGTCEEKI